MRENYWTRIVPPRIRRRRLLQTSVLGAAGIAGWAAVGCGNDDDENGGSPAPTPANGNGNGTEPTPSNGNGGNGGTPEGTATVVLSQPIAQIDPFKRLGGQDTHAIIQMFDSLLYRDPDGGYVPRLATEVIPEDNGTAYVFRLREGVRFHNGDVMTAEDVQFSFDRILDPEVAVSWRASVASYESCEIVDEMTVRVHLSEPDGAFPALLDPYFFIVPKNHIETVGNEAFTENPIGTGPFKYVSWDPQIGYEAEAFDDYWGDVPHVRNLRVQFVTDPQTRLSMLEAGEADIVAGIPPSQIERIENQFNIIRVPNAGNNYGEFQLASRSDGVLSPLDGVIVADPRVRQAINYAVDVPTIIDRVLFGTADQMSAAVAPGVLGYDGNLDPYQYDPDMARDLISQAGAEGAQITFNFSLGQETEGQAIADYLSEVGLNVVQERMEPLTLTQGRREATLNDMFLAGFPDYSYDPVTRLPIGFHSRGAFTNLVDEEIDRLIDEVTPIVDIEERDAIYQDVFRRHFDEAYYLFLYHPQVIYGARQNVEWSPQDGWPFLRDANHIRLT